MFKKLPINNLIRDICVCIFLSVFMVACHSGNVKSGDLAAFMQQQIARLGGHMNAITQVRTKQINCSWNSRADENGIQIFTNTNYFDAVDAFYRSLVGKPSIEKADSSGHTLIIYDVKRVGVMISYERAANFLHIILLKPQDI